MFSDSLRGHKSIGDVDVLYHEGLYHLFHLVLPNHDFIAHAVSTDGFNWRQVNNALFIGDPGSWDDLMLWTMHVSLDPYRHGFWRMFYTGLSRREQGRFQRIGLAVSKDLYHWRKTRVNWEDRRGPSDPELVQQARRLSDQQPVSSRQSKFDGNSHFPLQPDPRFYEASLDGDRNWVSFRDPFHYRDHDGKGWLLASGRIDHGPLVRRGCVAVMEEVESRKFVSGPALHHPGLYDDIEVPNLLRLESSYYLIGSIREDAKIRYWHADNLLGPWRSYHDNVLLPQGNYAGRICCDDQGWLIWNFYSMSHDDRKSDNLMPPPKRIRRGKHGLLCIESFEGFDNWVERRIPIRAMRSLLGAADERISVQDNAVEVESASGFHAFVLDEPIGDFRLKAKMSLQGHGKCGFVFRIDPDTHDGYYLSLDLHKCVAQLRCWGTGPKGSGSNMMQFGNLQSASWFTTSPESALVQLIAFGSYIELSIDGEIVLSLADRTYKDGFCGVYIETAHLRISDLEFEQLQPPMQASDQLAKGYSPQDAGARHSD